MDLIMLILNHREVVLKGEGIKSILAVEQGLEVTGLQLLLSCFKESKNWTIWYLNAWQRELLQTAIKPWYLVVMVMILKVGVSCFIKCVFSFKFMFFSFFSSLLSHIPSDILCTNFILKSLMVSFLLCIFLILSSW